MIEQVSSSVINALHEILHHPMGLAAFTICVIWISAARPAAKHKESTAIAAATFCTLAILVGIALFYVKGYASI
jgi:hypothetical protein